MSTNTAKVANVSDLAKVAGLTMEEVDALLAARQAELSATSVANAILLGGEHDGHTYKGVLFPEDSRDEEFKSVDDIRENIFRFAAFVMANVKVTDPGKADGSQKRTRADRRRVAIPTPSGDLAIVLTHESE